MARKKVETKTKTRRVAKSQKKAQVEPQVEPQVEKQPEQVSPQVKRQPEPQPEKQPQATCPVCSQPVPANQLLKHMWDSHHDYMIVQSSRGGRASQDTRTKAAPKAPAKPAAKLETTLPGGDSITGIDDTKKGEIEEGKGEAKVEAEVGKKTGEIEEGKGEAKVEAEVGKKTGEIEIVSEKKGEGPPAIPELVRGGGIPIRTEVSVKTLTYFQIAADIAGDNISLGDFFDTCVEDFFRGRGQSLGLVKLNPEKGKIKDEDRVREIVKEVIQQLTKKEE